MTLYATDKHVTEAIDEILKQIARLESDLGKDSNKRDRIVCRAKQNKLLLEIKEIDLEFYKIIAP